VRHRRCRMWHCRGSMRRCGGRSAASAASTMRRLGQRNTG
jgi:hypothetical protein